MRQFYTGVLKTLFRTIYQIQLKIKAKIVKSQKNMLNKNKIAKREPYTSCFQETKLKKRDNEKSQLKLFAKKTC